MRKRVFWVVLFGFLSLPVCSKAQSETEPPDEAVDRYRVTIETGTPSRATLFQLHSEHAFLTELKKEFSRQYPKENFLVPAPIDLFDHPNATTLGASWFQNRKTGSRFDQLGRRGDMGILNQQGVLPPGRFEAAILNQSVGQSNLLVSIDVVLADPQSRFGLSFRALDPGRSLEPMDQLTLNSFYFVTSSSDEVVAGVRLRGKEIILATKSVESKQRFKLEVTAYHDQITVARDGATVLNLTDDRLAGTHVGLIGRADSKPVVFDNFVAESYGGVYAARTLSPSSLVYAAPSVPYRPIYFEHVGIERYGHHMGNLVQPPLEHGAFYVDAVTIGYRLIVAPPWKCHSDIGYCKPGTIVLPFRLSFPDW